MSLDLGQSADPDLFLLVAVRHCSRNHTSQEARDAMDLRKITETYTAAPQLEPADMAALADLGVTTVICNRPDAENPAHLQAAAMQQAAEAAGLGFVYNPITGGAMTRDNVDEQADAIAGSDGPVVAYCASGTRSTVAWAFGAAADMPVDEVLAAAAQGGYQLQGLRPDLEAVARAARSA